MPAKPSKTRKRSKVAVENPARSTGISTAELAHIAGVSDRQIRQLVLEDVIPPAPNRGKFEPEPALRGVIVYLRSKNDELSKRSDSSDRVKAAEAAIKEFELAEKMKTVCRRDDYVNNYADAFTQMRDNIMRLTSISKEQKEAVFAALRGVKLADLEE